MNLRSVASYSLATLVLLVVIGVVHRHLGGLAPAPPVDVSNIALPVAPIPVPVVAAPTILQSQADDSDLASELDRAVARRPDPLGAAPASGVVPELSTDRPPDSALLVPIPPSKP